MSKLKRGAVDPVTLRSNPPVNMNLEEAAVYLGVCDRKVWGETASGRIKAARIGTRLIYPRVELDRYISLLVASA